MTKHDGQSTWGPEGSYGCGCLARTADLCGRLAVQAYPFDWKACQCLCHQWREEDGGAANRVPH